MPAVAEEVDIDQIPLLRWTGPEGSRPGTFAEYSAKFPVAPFEIERVNLPLPAAAPATPKVIVIANTTLYNNIKSRIDRYVFSISSRGYDVPLYTTSGGTAVTLKNYINNNKTDLVGCVFIGQLPAAWFEVADDFGEYGYAQFPCDLYFMDLDGSWWDLQSTSPMQSGVYDAHTDGSGDTAPEIFIARIDASMMTHDTEVNIMKDYFDKNNDYWLGNYSLVKYGLTYTEDDWAGYYDFRNDISYMYGSNYQAIAAPNTNRDDYLNNRLKSTTYEFIQLSCHSYSGGHSFTRGGWLYSSTIRTAPPQSLAYNLFCCSGCRYSDTNHLGGAYIFNTAQKALAAIGSTKTGSMLNFDYFYDPLGDNKTMGQAFKEWFEDMAPYTTSERDWYYGMTICGDPMITFISNSQPTGRYAVAGYTSSYSNGGQDFLVYKLAADGSMMWRKNYGGLGGDLAFSIRPTSDNGMIVAGWTDTYTNGSYDFLTYKINSNGTKLWRKNYGGSASDYLSTAIPTTDGGYLLFGETNSYTHGSTDFLVYKVNAAGQKQWRKNYGGDLAEWVWLAYPTGSTADQAIDGGYVFCGMTTSYTHGGWDFLVYKVNASGAKLWRRNLGGSGTDMAYAISHTSDGGYIVAGQTNTYSNGGNDFLVYKLNYAGLKLWRKNYGGSGQDYAYSVGQAGGGYVIGGTTTSYGIGGDFLIFRVGPGGAKLWRKNYGGTGYEQGNRVIPTSDGGYIICGYSDTITHGGDDFLVYKLNAAGQKQWRRNYGGLLLDRAYCICEVNN
jgi:hypothetical protein